MTSPYTEISAAIAQFNVENPGYYVELLYNADFYWVYVKGTRSPIGTRPEYSLRIYADPDDLIAVPNFPPKEPVKEQVLEILEETLREAV